MNIYWIIVCFWYRYINDLTVFRYNLRSYNLRKVTASATSNRFVGDNACKRCPYSEDKDWLSLNHFKAISTRVNCVVKVVLEERVPH